MMNKNIKLILTVLTIGAGATICVQPSAARTQLAELEERDEIIVTTRKRAEDLQKVPLSVTAINSEQMRTSGIDNAEDISRVTPSFTFAKVLGNETTTPVIRGMSTVIGEPNVGFFVNGVYQSSRNIMDAMLGENIARIEVAKGPQSALFGRNTFAGAINIITREPDDTTSGSITASIGKGGHREVKAHVSGPLSEGSVYGQLGAVHSTTDGFFNNNLTGESLDARESTVVSGAISYYPTDTTKIVFNAGLDQTRNGDYPQRFLINNNSPANPTPASIPPTNQLYRGEVTNFSDGFAVTPGFNNHDNVMLSLLAEVEFNTTSATFITGYNDLSIDNRIDSDFSAASIRLLDQATEQSEFSQEVRLVSSGESAFNWLIGGYYYNLELDRISQDRFVDGALLLSRALLNTPLSVLLPAGSLNSVFESTESLAVFGSVDYQLSEGLTATVEGRWTQEDKQVFTTDTNVLTQAVNSFEQDVTFTNFVPKVSLDYRLDNGGLLYVSAAKAIKTGGFNVLTATGAIEADERVYQPEQSWNYEIGWKHTSQDGSRRLNMAIFHTDWSDQIVRALGSNFAVLNANAGETSITGLEAEFRAKLSPELSLTINGAYIDSAYDRYTFQALADLGVSPVLDGTRLQYVSDYQAYASMRYSKPLRSRFIWNTHFDVSYQSDQSVIQTADAYIEDTTLVNLRTGISKDQWEITLWVENLFEEDTASGGVFAPNQGSRFNTALSLIDPRIPPRGYEVFNALSWSRTPRTWGATVRYAF